MSLQTAVAVAIREALKAANISGIGTAVSEAQKNPFPPSKSHIHIGAGRKTDLWVGAVSAKSRYTYPLTIVVNDKTDSQASLATVLAGVSLALRTGDHSADRFADELAVADSGNRWQGKGYWLEIESFESRVSPDGGTIAFAGQISVELFRVSP